MNSAKQKTQRQTMPDFIEAEPMPPNCVELETLTLAAMLHNDRWIPRIKSFLKAEYFYLVSHQEYYTWIIDTYQERRAVDGEMFFNRFYDDAEPHMFEELERIARDGGAGSYDAVQYAKLIQEDAARRQSIEVARRIVQEAYKPDGDVMALLSNSQAELRETAAGLTITGDSMDLKVSLEYHMAEMAVRANRPKDIPTDFTFNGRIGLPGLNKFIPPLEAGDSVGVLAEPGVGKTVLLEQFGDGWTQEGQRGAFFHLELAQLTMGDRRAQRYSGIPIHKLREAQRMTEAEWEKYLKAMTEIEKWPGQFHYVHCPGWTAGQIVSKAASIKEAHGLDYIIVDYFICRPCRNR